MITIYNSLPGRRHLKGEMQARLAERTAAIYHTMKKSKQ